MCCLFAAKISYSFNCPKCASIRIYAICVIFVSKGKYHIHLVSNQYSQVIVIAANNVKYLVGAHLISLNSKGANQLHMRAGCLC